MVGRNREMTRQRLQRARSERCSEGAPYDHETMTKDVHCGFELYRPKKNDNETEIWLHGFISL